MGIIDWFEDRGRDIADNSPSAWTALAAWVAVVVAIAATIYVHRQVEQAKQQSAALTQPNVAMFMEPSAKDWHLIELVVRNFGRKPAFGILFDFRNKPTVGQYENYEDNYVDIVPLNLPAEPRPTAQSRRRRMGSLISTPRSVPSCSRPIWRATGRSLLRALRCWPRPRSSSHP